jgi:hypothetical protein
MNNTIKYIIVGATALALFLALPFILKGLVVSFATLAAALVLAGVFLLGMCVALAVTSPLWVPFLAGWAAVMYCKKYHKNDTPPKLSA